jgi:hypothetical protein
MTEDPNPVVSDTLRRAVADGTIRAFPMRPETGQVHPGNRLD